MATVQESFENAPKSFRRHKAIGVEGSVQYDITGPGGGTWHLTVREETCSFEPGPLPSPDATLTASAEDWLAFVEGRALLRDAIAAGRATVRGDQAAFWKLVSLFSRE